MWTLHFEGSSLPLDPQNCQSLHVNGNVKFPAFPHARFSPHGSFSSSGEFQVKAVNTWHWFCWSKTQFVYSYHYTYDPIPLLECKLRHSEAKDPCAAKSMEEAYTQLGVSTINLLLTNMAGYWKGNVIASGVFFWTWSFCFLLWSEENQFLQNLFVIAGPVYTVPLCTL